MASTETPKITIHWLNYSRSHRIVWLLEELNLEYEIKLYKRGEDRLAPKELRDLHPLGKSPLLEIQTPGREKPLIIAESAFIVEYLTESFGKQMIPARFPEGKETIGFESEEWLRYRHLLHFAEGSFMPPLLIALMVGTIRDAPVPFFIKPVTKSIAQKINDGFLSNQLKQNFAFVESQVASSPDAGEFLCGKSLTGADIMMIFPLQGAMSRGGLNAEEHPKTVAYVKRLEERDAYKRGVQKIVDLTGEPFSPVFQ
ncbi:glutathione S-transferase [Eremomyces bilateralis CBS 781.70]|uniref:glutathione transferase n=1 Tax=Eremomyces bilateralis CBS 781.70 TaxID=1392243 RepID=A0A6G1G0Q2_9PEZI|nr:glutathione S-transferase [Eremomyces bilateralis CBS 781.70]KAF1811506.1 glutathione S-transferase [Eremomyces bilateralis CBS 781.70]